MANNSRILGSTSSTTDPADTSAARLRPAPPSPCSAKSPTPARSPKSATAPTGAPARSLPSPPRSTLAFSLAHSQGSPGSWSTFSCRAVISIQLPSTARALTRQLSWQPCLNAHREAPSKPPWQRRYPSVCGSPSRFTSLPTCLHGRYDETPEAVHATGNPGLPAIRTRGQGKSPWHILAQQGFEVPRQSPLTRSSDGGRGRYRTADRWCVKPELYH